MEVNGVISHLIVVFVTAVVSGIIAKKLRQPVILGYLLGGLIVGGLSGIGSSFRGEISLFAELGVALLMFLLGIEFSYRRFKRVGSFVIVASVMQIILTIFLGTFVLTTFGLSFYYALFFSCVFSLSSTAVVVKTLAERGMVSTASGEISIGWLIMQDLAVLPLLVLLPVIGKSLVLGSTTNGMVLLLTAFVKSTLLIFAVLFPGKYIVSRLLKMISQFGSRELLVLSSFTICIILAWLSQQAGLSFALGAFLAGVLVSQTKVVHAVFSEIRPLRDLFSSVFFVSLGFLVDPAALRADIYTIVLLVLLFIFLKFLIVFSITFSFGFHSRIAFYTALSLVQVGEFAFVIGQVGVSQNIIPVSMYSIILAVAIITILFTPLLVNNSARIYRTLQPARLRLKFLRNIFLRRELGLISDDVEYKDHVVILGYGRVGKYIGRALSMEKIPFVVVDFNRYIIDNLEDEKIPCVYGDPSDIEVMKFADVEMARALVVTIPDLATAQICINHAKIINHAIVIFCRSHIESNSAVLEKMGVSHIINPEFEASLTLVRKLLNYFGRSKSEQDGKVARLRIVHGMQS